MPPNETSPGTRQFVLCFDGTGNKFQGNESDSNVLKIFRMLDRSDSEQCHYYQPGIGTYVTTRSFNTPGPVQRMKSAYSKAKDAALGSTFADHVMGGYKFLMRYYCPGDQLYFFGFSRGAYVARFLAEMLDFVGLLEMGNEELVRFAWKIFAKWQQRRSSSDDSASQAYQRKREEHFQYMAAFRETFSRPVTQIQFLGLFDTVNSVPRFETAWLQRSKFPYTARTSARVIRHAVSIDERRAKFRQDLISEEKPRVASGHRLRRHLRHRHFHAKHGDVQQNDNSNINTQPGRPAYAVYRPSRHSQPPGRQDGPGRAGGLSESEPPGPTLLSAEECTSTASAAMSGHDSAFCGSDTLSDGKEDEDDLPQDIQEVWFPGCHADIGGGWKLHDGEEWPLSHPSLVWMVTEARQAGLRFKRDKLKKFQCWDGSGIVSHKQTETRTRSNDKESQRQGTGTGHFYETLHKASTEGKLHDCLSLHQGLPFSSVLSWKLMEWMPFRRMDLQSDGSWKPIRWPLPRGEVRDMPADAQVHVSAIWRLEADPDYRPGNLIIGGGGRGVKKAPKEYGIGEWSVARYPGCPVRETFVRKHALAHPDGVQ
ncbi:hypothetical protein BJX61DRAFT_552959 [Aspergillus egyptiacus]|nr:hypothetical protein BJX61DRAFT_552959 [Aspergillus egyptiacus]